MLTAFKTPLGILCHCILSALLLVSTISQHSVRLSVCKPLRADQSPFAASAPHFLSPSAFYPPFQLLFFIPSPLSSPLPSHPLSFMFWCLWSLPVFNFLQFPCPIISLLHLLLVLSRPNLPPPCFPLLSYSPAKEEDKTRAETRWQSRGD